MRQDLANDKQIFIDGYFYGVTVDHYRAIEPDVEALIQNASTVFAFNHRLNTCGFAFSSGFSGQFAIQSTTLDNRSVSVETLATFSYYELHSSHSDDWNFRSGVLRIVAADGSELILDTHSGNEATVVVQLTDDLGTQRIIQPWSLWRHLVPFDSGC